MGEMAETRVTPQDRISGVLRANLEDYNATARAAAGLSVNWIYPDKPRIKNLEQNIANFPRIGITVMPKTSTGEIGVGGTETEDEINILVNIYTIKEKLVTVGSVVNEEHTFLVGTTEYELDEIPVTSISDVTGTGGPFVKGTDYQLYDVDSDGRYDSIQWLDVTNPTHATVFYVDYVRQLEGVALAEYIAQDVNVYIRDNWREDIHPTLYEYRLVRQQVLSTMNDRVQRCELQVKFKGINIGD
jgi:hypothetical protein